MTFLNVITTLTLFMDFTFIMTLVYFARPLSWKYERASIIGFIAMIVVLIMNMALLIR